MFGGGGQGCGILDFIGREGGGSRGALVQLVEWAEEEDVERQMWLVVVILSVRREIIRCLSGPDPELI